MVIVTGWAVMVLTPEPVRRALLIALTVGVVSALCSDWMAKIAVTVFATLAFVLYVGHAAETPRPWEFMPLFGFAALIGAGYRRLAQESRVERE
ncbi:hypothetical protein [Actinoplanes solisilvae]|uniref:hypothetical protein n=1 Tax=Actinoplanes solisilvae TaxID=2486853 RepID=UPI000FD6BC32|nr:hypothetical protein [Actinoplanes solisilvae]